MCRARRCDHAELRHRARREVADLADYHDEIGLVGGIGGDAAVELLAYASDDLIHCTGVRRVNRIGEPMRE
ncbi:MAG TPA: hypothetical protein VKV73_00720 [Chloroflexota bacterium]|nr:hypothetical protein [Chloroflexota bacterium]